jgi:hypothetical protein
MSEYAPQSRGLRNWKDDPLQFSARSLSENSKVRIKIYDA